MTLRALTTSVLQADAMARDEGVIVVEIGACDGSSFDPIHAFIKVGQTPSPQDDFLHGCALYLSFVHAFMRVCMRACVM